MATRILDLPHLLFPMQVGNNEDWLDAWPYLDGAGAPIPFDGIVLNFMVRAVASDGTLKSRLAVIASTAQSVLGLPTNGWITAQPGVVALTVPRETMLLATAGAYLHETQAVGDGITRTIASGSLTVVQGVVR